MRKDARKRNKRRLERQEEAAAKEEEPYPTHPLHPFISTRFGKPDYKLFQFNADSFPTARTVFVGKHLGRDGDDLGRVFSLGELKERGVTVIRWDGRTPMVIIDDEKRIVIILAGRPGRDWSTVMKRIEDAFIRARDKGYDRGVFLPGKVVDKRGDFPKLFSGYSFGTGQPAPAHWTQEREEAQIVADLIQDENVARLAGFQNSCFATYAPKLFAEYVRIVQALHSTQDNLRQNFKASIFPAASFNLGPTECFVHRDSQNIPFGLCAVTSAGQFDPTKGGHLVLWELGIAIEFPSGSTILIPSAAISHGNTAIQAGETRMSMTQFCAGGLFRWVQYGFKTIESLKLTAKGRKKIVEMAAGNADRWKWAIGLFSKLDELVNDHQILNQLMS